MQTSTAQILQGVPVWTRLGERIGRVHDVEFDIDTGKMVALHVRVGRWVPLTNAKTLIIFWKQIVEITHEKVVVEDAVVKELQVVLGSIGGIPVAPTPV